MHDFLTFDYFRVVFVFLLIILVINMIITTFQKKESKVINGYTVISISFISLGVGLLSLYKIGNITDELNLKGDTLSTYMVIGIGLLSLINLVIYFVRNRAV